MVNSTVMVNPIFMHSHSVVPPRGTSNFPPARAIRAVDDRGLNHGGGRGCLVPNGVQNVVWAPTRTSINGTPWVCVVKSRARQNKGSSETNMLRLTATAVRLNKSELDVT